MKNMRSSLIRFASENPEFREIVGPWLSKTAKDLPPDVERYVQEGVSKGMPEDKAWAIAWSRYCKYKNPDSEHCQKGPSGYFKGRKADVEALAGVVARRASHRVILAHKPILQREGLDANAVQQGMGAMLYMIDAAKNNSKFYEMLIVPGGGGGFTLMRRWGALTDTGQTGRIDSIDMEGMSLRSAQAEMAKIYRNKVGKGYKDAFNRKMHVGPQGGPLPFGQYPVGLTRDPGFGWGSQSATRCIPSLRDLQEKLDGALNELEEDSDLTMLLADVEAAQRLIALLMRNPLAVEYETNKSMGDILNTAMRTPINRMKMLQGGTRQGPGRLPDLDRGKLRSELVAIRNYVRKQLSYCA